MKRIRQALNSTIVLIALGFLPLFPVHAQGNLTLVGHIITQDGTQQATPRFSVKLYPPLKSGRTVLLTNSDERGRFRFTGLSASSYLLEIYLVEDLVYQGVIKLNSNETREIDLRKKTDSSRAAPYCKPNQSGSYAFVEYFGSRTSLDFIYGTAPRTTVSE
jgi:hypothetical protein